MIVGSRWWVAALCAAIGFAGCRERPAPTAAPASSPAGIDAPAQAVATLRGRVRADLQELTILALADDQAAPGTANADMATVGAIEIYRSNGSLLQRIDGLQARTAATSDPQVLELLDLNFDGYADLRLREAPSAGPNTSHVNWLFDAARERFVSTPELDDIPGVTVVAAARELRSEWRDGPATYGADIYVWRDAKPVPIRRERRTYSAPGAFVLEISQPDGAGWKVVQRSEGRD